MKSVPLWSWLGVVWLVACGSNEANSGLDAQGDPTDALADALSADVADVAVVDVAPDVPVAMDVAPLDVPPLDVVPNDTVLTDLPPADVDLPPQDVIADVPALDIVAPDSDGNPMPCQGGFMGGGTCSDPNQTCWSPPCPKCGAKPTGWCVPTVTSPLCYDYTGCSSGVCEAANGMAGLAGYCVDAVKPGSCWPAASSALPQCYEGSTCEGAILCPPWAKCKQAAKPGTCTADMAHADQVDLWVRNGGLVSPGESVTVTWVNLTSKSVFLPGCSTYNVQQGDGNGGWKDLGPTVACVWEGTAVEVPAGGYVDTMPWTAPNTFTGGALPMYRLEGTYSTGCTPGQPISAGKCTGSAVVDSSNMTIGLAP